MGSATLTPESADLIDVGNARSGTRHSATAGGETRSRLFQRLRAECVWDDAERLKEQVRTECRNRGETKRQAGIIAWNAIAKAYPVADAVTWNAFVSRSLRAPGISTAADVTKESATLAAAWAVSMKLLGSLSTRCPEVTASCHPVLDAIDVRLRMEPADGLSVNETALGHLIESMVENPKQYVEAAQRLFSKYKTTGSPYSAAVADELHKLFQLMELSTPLVEKQWPRISLWLWGPRASNVTKYLTHACEA
jgi:hypothetical protein